MAGSPLAKNQNIMKNKNILSVVLSVIASVGLVALVTYAATTIGTNISADGTITAVGQLRASSTALFTGDVTTYGNTTFGNENTDVNLFTGMLQASTTALFTATTTMYNDLVVDTNTLFVDTAKNMVGVGTTSPLGKLHVHGDIIISNDDHIYGRNFAGDGNFSVYHLSTADNQTFGDSIAGYASINAGSFIRLNANGSELMRLTGGNVGIGTSTPTDLLHVHDNTATSTIFISSGGVGLGGEIIVEDVDGAGCTELTTLDGVGTFKAVACPTN